MSRSKSTITTEQLEAYRVMRPHTQKERAAFKEAIREVGGIGTVILDESGNLIDGRLRVELWQELRDEGVDLSEYVRDIRPGLTDAEKRTLARSLNVNHRHLRPRDRRKLIDDQLKDTPERTDRQIADLLGTTHSTVGARRRLLEGRGEIRPVEVRTDTKGRKQPVRRISCIARNPSEEARACKGLKKLEPTKEPPGKVLNVWDVERLVKQQNWEKALRRRPDRAFNMDGCDLRCGDCEEALANVEPGSVKLIMTDPPYRDKDIKVRAWQKLGRIAARLLQEDGVLAAYAGHLRKDEEIAHLTESLDWYWEVCLPLDEGPHCKVKGTKFINHWRSILLLTRKGCRSKHMWMEDLVPDLARGFRSKTHGHPDEQNGATPVWLIACLTNADDLVVDPFMGTGTFGEAALFLDRRFIGCEIKRGYYATAQRRMKKLQKECKANADELKANAAKTR